MRCITGLPGTKDMDPKALAIKRNYYSMTVKEMRHEDPSFPKSTDHVEALVPWHEQIVPAERQDRRHRC